MEEVRNSKHVSPHNSAETIVEESPIFQTNLKMFNKLRYERMVSFRIYLNSDGFDPFVIMCPTHKNANLWVIL